MVKRRSSKPHQAEKDIRVFKGLEAVRKRPAMYIGPTDSHGIFTILREAMDNSVDEYLANNDYDSMTVQIYENGYLAVHDNGGGIPVGRHKTEKISTLQVATGMLHAGGKLEDSAYKASRGTHGVGVAVTNALSQKFQVFTHRQGYWHVLEYSKGKVVNATKQISIRGLKKIIEPVYKQGTIILFTPDMTVFRKGSELDIDLVSNWAKTTAYLSGGFNVTIQSEIDESEETFFFEHGTKDWLEDSLEELDCGTLLKKPIEIKSQHLDLCLTMTDAEGCRLQGYCNGLQQEDGGDHINTTLSALYASLKPYTLSKDNFNRDDVSEGVLGIVNYKIDSPEFSSQTKEKLADKRFNDLCRDDIINGFKEYWLKNKTLAKEVCKRASALRTVKVDFSAQKQALRNLKNKRNDTMKLPLKLAVAPECDPKDRELFLVEGESAGGTARMARMTNPRFQETLGLKGKVPNTYKTKLEKILANEEVLNILTAIGYEPERKDPLKNLRVGKIILLSDPDFDGYHIDSLLLALLVHFLPELFDMKMVYKSISPKYMLVDKGKQYFGMTLDELRENTPKNVNTDKATYLKGWGEADADAMRDIAFNPLTRHLQMAEPPTRSEVKKIELLMGENPDYRKEMLGV